MTVSVRQESFDSVWERWEEILPLSATNTVFVSPWWHKTWWDNFGEGSDSLILSVSDDDQLLGIAPLMADGNGAITFLGDKDLYDYLDFVVPRDKQDKFYSAMVDHLSDLDWTNLELPSLPSGSPTLERLPELARAKGWEVSVEEEETTPKAELPGSWDEFLAGLRKKDRHELRRKIRRLDRESENRQYAAANGDSLDGSMREFFTLLRASREDKSDFLTPDREKFFLDMAHELASRDQFRLYFLEVDGEKVAACICFDYGDDFLLYNSGYEPAYSRLSVGLINKALSIRTAIEENRKVFNFLKGNERYKYNLGGRDEAVFHMSVTR
jgi:CelD/BcsL family acetyltransferase involved in cellulose biosynthesis